MKTKMNYLCSAFRKVVPSDYEAWFEKLALEGWHPHNITHTSSFVMSFIKDEPKKYRYVVDLQATPKENYISMYQDFGWEFVGQMSSIFVWRKEYTNDRPEAFSDKESIKKRNRRFTKAIAFSLAIFSIASIAITASFLINISRLDVGGIAQFILGMALSYSLTFLFASVIYKISKAKESE